MVTLSLSHMIIDMSRTLYRLKGAKGAFRPPHESSTLREPGTKGCRTYPAVVILPQAATTTPSPDLRLGARAGEQQTTAGGLVPAEANRTAHRATCVLLLPKAAAREHAA